MSSTRARSFKRPERERGRQRGDASTHDDEE
jgi:hypothetical protein